MLHPMEPAHTQTREWRGHVKPGAEQAHEQLVAWLNSEEARRLIGRYPLTEYRLEQRGNALTVTMTATEPTGLVRFLRWPRVWPTDVWEFEGTGRPEGELPPPESLGPALRVHWRRERSGPGPDASSR
jgi:hypothetical protein